MSNIICVIPEDSMDAEPMVYAPLGLLYIAAVLEKNGHDVSIYDMREKDNSIEKIPFAYNYCFTAVTAQIQQVTEAARYVRNAFGAFTVIGGAHASWMSRDVKDDFEAVVIGEGEDVITSIIENRECGIFNANIGKKKDINDVPFPARHLLPDDRIANRKLWDGYRFNDDNSPVATTLISSRGCPWKCAFCANVPQPVRFRTPDNVTREIETLIESYGCHHFRFLDDNFVTEKRRLKEMSERFAPLGIGFRCSARSDQLDEDTCTMLVKAGCREIGFGVESGDNRVLKMLNKNETIEHHRRAIQLARAHGLKTKAFLMAGLPGETWESIELTKNFIEEVRPDKWILTFFTPFPGSPIINNPEKYNIEVIEQNFSKYVQSYPTKSTIKTNVASNEELGEHYDALMSFLRSLYNV